MLNDLRQNNLRKSDYFIGHGHTGDESIFDFVKRFSPWGVPDSASHPQNFYYGVMVTLVDRKDHLEVSVQYFRDAEETGRVFNSVLNQAVPGHGPKKELIRAKDEILSDIIERLPGIQFDFSGMITNVERAFKAYSIPELLAASVQYEYGSGEALADYLVNNLEVMNEDADQIVEIFQRIDL